jgi:hypothetical protein
MSLKNIFQLEIPRRNSQCALGQETFSPGMDYHSLLIEEDSGIQRQDFCNVCWNPEFIAKAKIHWRSKVSAKKEISSLPHNRDERALLLLKEAIKGESQENRMEAFVLALYLARKKILHIRHESNKKVNDALILYEVSDTEEIIPIKKIDLSQIEIEETQKGIANKLRKIEI